MSIKYNEHLKEKLSYQLFANASLPSLRIIQYPPLHTCNDAHSRTFLRAIFIFVKAFQKGTRRELGRRNNGATNDRGDRSFYRSIDEEPRVFDFSIRGFARRIVTPSHYFIFHFISRKCPLFLAISPGLSSTGRDIISAALIVNSVKVVRIFLQPHRSEKRGLEFQRAHTFTIVPDEDLRRWQGLSLRVSRLLMGTRATLFFAKFHRHSNGNAPLLRPGIKINALNLRI